MSKAVLRDLAQESRLVDGKLIDEALEQPASPIGVLLDVLTTI